ncbi:MAG: molybdopterin-dependent oxidoreductase [Bacillota bacterium]|nr:molybdopterin-dependent oxidoreductase [Bacillota bacterium]
MWKKLKQIHYVNIWVIAFLFVSGFLLFLPSLRGALATIRVPLKQAHIWIGFLSFLLLLLYVRYSRSHLKTIKKQAGKKWNLSLIITLLLGWTMSGFILTFEKSMSGTTVQNALLLHDLFTWFGLPITLYHSITRSRWIKKKIKQHEKKPSEQKLYTFSRRGFFRYGIGTLLVIILGPFFYKWVKQLSDNGGDSFKSVVSNSKTQLSPLPVPAKQSSPPIGGGYVGQFRVYTVTETPTFTNDNWEFKIDGLVDHPITFTWEEFVQLRRTVQVSDFHCVTGWSVRHVTYEGIPLKELLNKAGLQKKATHLKFFSGDGVYTDSLTIDQANMDDIMVAMLMDGNLIPSDYGGPVRLIVPKMYAYKSVKWLVRIEAIDHSYQGYWQVRGYDTDAWVKQT